VPHGGPQASLGLAALTARIPLDVDRWVEGNADRALHRCCPGKRLALIGRFGLADTLRSLAASVAVLELGPLPGESPAEQAADSLPESDLIVITGMALVNLTLERPLALCRHGSEEVLVGPSVPMRDVFFDYGVDLLCGALVEQPARVMTGIRQGADSHQLHRLGTCLVVMEHWPAVHCPPPPPFDLSLRSPTGTPSPHQGSPMPDPEPARLPGGVILRPVAGGVARGCDACGGGE
jgi:uncharacterized protein (DUF4213/DUF364 family)